MKIENVFFFKYLILIAIFLPLRQADMKFRNGLCSVQIFNAILRTVFSAAAQLPPSVGQTCSQLSSAEFPQTQHSEG
jgi:hypothetical protein